MKKRLLLCAILLISLSSISQEITLFKDINTSDGSNGIELWVTDGTEEGTFATLPAIALNYGPLASNYSITEFNDYMYFNADYTSVGNEMLRGAVTAPIDEAPKLEFTIYPNSTKAVLFVSVEDQEIENIRLFGLYGKEMATISISGGNEINISNLKSGTYLIQIVTGKGASKKRFVKSNKNYRQLE